MPLQFRILKRAVGLKSFQRGDSGRLDYGILYYMLIVRRWYSSLYFIFPMAGDAFRRVDTHDLAMQQRHKLMRRKQKPIRCGSCWTIFTSSWSHWQISKTSRISASASIQSARMPIFQQKRLRIWLLFLQKHSKRQRECSTWSKALAFCWQSKTN